MSARLDVPFAVVKAARERWDVAGDELDGAWRRLAKTATGGLSPAVAAAVEAFREPWADELKAAGEQAQGYATEIVFFRGLVVVADQRQAERLRSLLPWSAHVAAITSR